MDGNKMENMNKTKNLGTVKSKPTGKTFSIMIQLKANILKRLNCVVGTIDPEKTKRDFEHMTGSKLKLEARNGSKYLYDASLDVKK